MRRGIRADNDAAGDYGKGCPLPSTTVHVSVDDIGPKAIEQIVTAATKRANTEPNKTEPEHSRRPRDSKKWKNWP